MLGLSPSGIGSKLLFVSFVLGWLWVGAILYGINGIYGQAPALPVWFAVCFWLLWVVLSLWLVAASFVAQRQGRTLLGLLAIMLGGPSFPLFIQYLRELIK